MTSVFKKLIDLANLLDEAGIHYSLAHHSPEALMVQAAVPGQRWEIEVFDDGHFELEIFKSAGDIYDEDQLLKLVSTFAG